MTPTSPKIIFFGTENYSLEVLKALVENGVSIAAVVTKPDAPRGRGQRITEPPIKTFALTQNIPVWQPTNIRDIADDVKGLSPVAGILVAYGKIIPQQIIDLFSPGIINIHPSLLPRWRGPSPIEAAIAARDDTTGVSIMKLDARMDGGPIYKQEVVKLSGKETKPELYETLFRKGTQILIEILPDILAGTLQPTPQDDDVATYCMLLSKKDSLIDPSKISAIDAEAKVRAHLGFPRTKITLSDKTLIITRAHVEDTPPKGLHVQCKDGKYLVIDELIAPSGKTMTAEAFARGYL